MSVIGIESESRLLNNRLFVYGTVAAATAMAVLMQVSSILIVLSQTHSGTPLLFKNYAWAFFAFLPWLGGLAAYKRVRNLHFAGDVDKARRQALFAISSVVVSSYLLALVILIRAFPV